jgi:5-methylcytosine-specific restriction endonuclease McrA
MSKETSLAYYYKHKKIRNAKMKDWYEKNKKQQLIKSAKYYQEHKEEHLKRSNKYNQTHKVERRKWYLKTYPLRKEKIAEYIKSWNQTLRGKISRKVTRHNRRILESKFSKLTPKLIKEVYIKNTDNNGNLVCSLCKGIIIPDQETLEHFIPITRAKDFPDVDLNHISNLGLAHGVNSKENCNGHKYNRTLEEWVILNEKEKFCVPLSEFVI